MRQNKSIKLKAAFLLTVFALNTVVAFACSVGLNMGYNKKHHDEKKEKKLTSTHSHSHAPGSKSHHNNTAATQRYKGILKHNHKDSSSHIYENAPLLHNHKQSNSENDDCCTDNAIKFQNKDKKPYQSQNLDIKAPVFVAFLSAFLGFDLAPVKTTGNKFFVPQFYPPPDIRIAIQSFQI